jgi:hypothetical protein
MYTRRSKLGWQWTCVTPRKKAEESSDFDVSNDACLPHHAKENPIP